MPGWVPIDGNMDRGANGDNSNPTSTVRLCNWLINKEKSRFEAGCGAKWRICVNLPVYNSLNWLGFSLLMGLLAPQQPQISDFPSDFSELLNRTVEVGFDKAPRSSPLTGSNRAHA